MGGPFLQVLEAGRVLCYVISELSVGVYSRAVFHSPKWQEDGGSLVAWDLSKESALRMERDTAQMGI